MNRLRQLHIGFRKSASLFLMCAVLFSILPQEAMAAGEADAVSAYMATETISGQLVCAKPTEEKADVPEYTAETFSGRFANAEPAAEKTPQDSGKVMWLSGALNCGQTKHFTTKRSASQRMAEISARRTSDVRGRGQSRYLENLVGMLLFSALQLYVYFCSDVRSKQCELVMKSREIVEYLRRADGKKNGLVFS